jgi:ferritin-like metal-binding protein YciE
MTLITNSTKAFQLKLRTLFDIEEQLQQALPKMIAASHDTELVEGFTAHLEETKAHSERLKHTFALMNVQPETAPSAGIRGIIEDATAIIDTEAPGHLKDALLAASGRLVEYFEIASYLVAVEEARDLGYHDIADTLEETLEEERVADKKLAMILKHNFKASREDEVAR